MRNRLRTFWQNRGPMLWALAVGLAYAHSSPAQGLEPFTDEAVARGISYVPVEPAEPDVVALGQGLAFVDLNSDDSPDVVLLGSSNGLVGIYENDGRGFFIDRSTSNGVPLLSNAKGVSAGDYDRDGDLDLYLTQGTDYLFFPDYETPNVLLRNEGGFQFTDVTSFAGVRDHSHSYSSAWGDYDNDGWVDLYVSNRFQPNRLYRNLGDGTFVDVAVSLGVDRGGDPTFQSSFFDYDRDGDADLYVANDKADGCVKFQNHFFENTGGSFVDVTNTNGTEACVSSMCIAFGDFNENGYQDIYVTNLPSGNALMINQGNGLFTREENAAGVASDAYGWGSVFFDFDNDTIQDLYVCNYFPSTDHNRLYRYTGSWPASDVAATCQVESPGESFAVASADIENDGDLDLLVLNWDEPIRLFVNQEGEQREWVKFRVAGLNGERHAIGANLRIHTGQKRQIREVVAGSNYMSQNELIVHFGLADATVVDEIEVFWPGGTTRTLTDYPAGQTWTLYPPSRLGDANGDGQVRLDDLGHFQSCFRTPALPVISAGCEMMDLDGDGDVDLDDYGLISQLID